MGHPFTPPQSQVHLITSLQRNVFYLFAALIFSVTPYEQSERYVAPPIIATIGFNRTWLMEPDMDYIMMNT